MTNKVFSLMCSQEKASKPRYFNKPLRLFLKMSRPEIPGFYFDETRNRYFKLTTARTGVTASTEYSSSSQATLKRKAESTNADDDGDGEDISNIGSHIYFDNIAGLEPPEKYPNGMVPTLADRACWSMAHAGNNSRGKRTLQNVLATSLLQPFDFIDTRRLAANSLLTRMVVLDNETILYGNNSGAVNSVSFDHRYYFTKSYKNRKNFGYAGQPVTARAERLLMEMANNVKHASFEMFTNPNMITDISGCALDCDVPIMMACSMGREQTPGQWGIITLIDEGHSSVTSSAGVARELKFGDAFCVAINKSMIGSCGTNNGFIMTEVRPDSFNSSKSRFIHEGSDVLSVVYLNKIGKPCALLGCRNGTLINLDYRKKASAAIKQKVVSGISTVKNIKDHYVLIAGIGNEMKLFDLRMMSESVLQYYGYENESNTFARLSVSDKGDKIAYVASESRIQLFDTWNGQQLEFPNSTLVSLDNGEIPIDNKVVDVQWNDHNRSSGLLVGTKDGITRYEIS